MIEDISSEIEQAGEERSGSGSGSDMNHKRNGDSEYYSPRHGLIIVEASPPWWRVECGEVG